MFDADGGGMHFIAYDVGQGNDLHNPYLSREQMRLVMARSLALYQDRHVGVIPRQLVIHKQTPFTPDEVAGCFDAWGATTELACVTLERPNGAASSSPANASPDTRSTAAPSCPSTATRPSSGSPAMPPRPPSPAMATSCRKKGTPRPVLMTRHAGRGPLIDLAGQILALTKMNWNNDALHDSLPCTIRYAQTLARSSSTCPVCYLFPTITACSCKQADRRGSLPRPSRQPCLAGPRSR